MASPYTATLSALVAALLAGAITGHETCSRNSVRVLQWNLLADGLSDDGFLPRAETFKSVNDEVFETSQFMKMLKTAKAGKSLEYFATLFATDEAKELDEEVLGWENRFPRILDIIENANPDIMTFQEMDHMKQFQEALAPKYACSFEEVDSYEPTEFSNSTEYLSTISSKGYAFAPKASSPARKYRNKRIQNNGGEEQPVDDDGVAIFWNKDRFKLVELGFMEFPQDKKGKSMLAAILFDKKTKEFVNVYTTHLASGKDKEVKRLEALSGVVLEEDEFVSVTGQRSTITVNDITYDGVEGGILGFIGDYQEKYPNAMNVFSLDANSDPRIPKVPFLDGEEANVWSLLQEKKPELKSVWPVEDDTNLPEEGVVSVNKMRGPRSNQPKKIGEHALELIDHIFTNAKVCLLETLRGVYAPERYGSVEEAEINLIPHQEMPSDHYPVLATLS